MAVSKIKTHTLKTAEVTLVGNSTNSATASVPTIDGYTPVGIIGQHASTNNAGQLVVDLFLDGTSAKVYWAAALGSSNALTVVVLYQPK